MNSDEKIDKLSNDMTEVKVTLGRLESCLHPTPCVHLSDHEERNRSDIRKLHEKHEAHLGKHHSSGSSRDNLVAIAVIGCTIATVLSPFIQNWLK